jgi:hypothetical protein
MASARYGLLRRLRSRKGADGNGVLIGARAHPATVPQTSVSANENVPVQNGKAIFSIEATATFQPDCTPPMTVVFTDVSVCDTTNNICCTL